MEKNKLTLINASAGTGKTYTLVEKLTEENAVSLENVVATTFTKKAAAELKSRIREKLLIDAGKEKDKKKREESIKAATLVLNGKIGTVNSVFGKMVSDNAFALGISPETGIVTDDAEKRLFKAATADILNEFAEKEDFTAAAERFGCQDSWFGFVKTICEKARQNGIADMEESKQASLDFFEGLLPSSETEKNEKKIKETAADNFQELKESGKLKNKALRSLENKNIEDWSWKDWQAMSDLADTYSDLKSAAENYLSFPSLRKDLELIVDTVFDCAKKCLDAYDEAKKKLGVIDYTDQETMALKLLEENSPAVERVEKLYVDEFQDTSPVQLALFSRLREASGAEAVYVGDPKQAIYKFRGTDPRLIAEVCETVPKEGREVLDKSYRTVKTAVEFVNGVFLDKFKNAGMTKEQISIEGFDRENTVSGFQKAVQVWPGTGNQDLQYEAVAKQIKILLKESKVIYDKRLKKERPIRGGDIAVLFRSNSHIEKFAKIAQEYFKVAASAGTLQDRETGILLTAALTLLIDKKARLAKARILKVVGKFDAAAFDAENEIFNELDVLRKRRSDLTPSETVDEVLALPFVRDYFQKLCPDTELAYAEADAFRGAAAVYENSCAEERIPATLEDFLSNFDADAPASNDKDAVVVKTYHAAKGLEWNVVVCMDCETYESNLHRYAEDVFTVHVDRGAKAPFGSGRILFLPWIESLYRSKRYIKVGGRFEELINKNTDIKKWLTEAGQEHDRLMYVGMTRARDCLILYDSGKNFYCPEQRSAGQTEELTSSEPLERDGGAVKKTFAVTMSKKTFETPFLVTPSDGKKQKDVPFETIDLPALKNKASVKATAETGTLFHAVLALKKPSEEKIKRILSGEYAPLVGAAVEIKERFDREIVRLLKDGDILTEWPVAATNEKGQLIRGTADCILVQKDGFYIVDHKILDRDASAVKDYAGELFRYAEAVEKLTGQKCKGCVLHLPLQDEFLRFSYRKD